MSSKDDGSLQACIAEISASLGQCRRERDVMRKALLQVLDALEYEDSTKFASDPVDPLLGIVRAALAGEE